MRGVARAAATFLLGWSVIARAAAAAPPALTIEAGSVAGDRTVALGRDLVVRGEVTGDAAVVGGSGHVAGRIAGDLIVLGGDADLAASARIGGDVFVLGGRVDTRPGARIDGRIVSYPTVSAAWLTLLEGPSLGLSALSPLVIAAKLALLAAWLLLALGLFAVAGDGVLATCESIVAEPLRDFLVGLTGVLAMLMTALLVSVVAPGLVGAPLLVLVVLFALLLKLWGMVALFHALGAWLARSLLGRRLRPLNAACLGLVVLGVVKLVPWLGTLVWTTATFVAVGAALTTKLGRREPWFQTGGLPDAVP